MPLAGTRGLGDVEAALPVMETLDVEGCHFEYADVRPDAHLVTVVVEGVRAGTFLAPEDYLTLDGFRFAPGESIYFDSEMGHAYICAGEEACRILLICVTEGRGVLQWVEGHEAAAEGHGAAARDSVVRALRVTAG